MKLNNFNKNIIALSLTGTMLASAVPSIAHADTNTTDVVEDDEQTYTVSNGDTLSEISEKYYGKSSYFKQLAKYNKITNPDLIYIGQKIYIPSLNTLLDVNESDSKSEENNFNYTIKSGDTLTSICVTNYGDGSLSMAWKLATYNNLSNPEKIYAGNKLILPSKDTLLSIESNDYSWCYEKPYSKTLKK